MKCNIDRHLCLPQGKSIKILRQSHFKSENSYPEEVREETNVTEISWVGLKLQINSNWALHSIGLGVGWRNTVTIYLLNVQCLWQTVIIIASLIPHQSNLFKTIILIGVGHFILRYQICSLGLCWEIYQFYLYLLLQHRGKFTFQILHSDSLS